MKRKKMLVMATVLAMLFGLAQVAGASIPNHFTSTSSESNISNDLGYLNDGWVFGVYDFDATTPNPSGGLDLLLGGSTSFKSANFSVTQSGANNTWEITVTSGMFLNPIPILNILNIGDSDDFSFYFRDGSGSTYDIDFSITGGDLNYGFISTAGGGVSGHDLNPVPLPGTAIFLFSGIMGLVAFGSRRKIMK